MWGWVPSNTVSQVNSPGKCVGSPCFIGTRPPWLGWWLALVVPQLSAPYRRRARHTPQSSAKAKAQRHSAEARAKHAHGSRSATTMDDSAWLIYMIYFTWPLEFGGFIWIHMGVSKNGEPAPQIDGVWGKSHLSTDDLEVPLFQETSISALRRIQWGRFFQSSLGELWRIRAFQWYGGNHWGVIPSKGRDCEYWDQMKETGCLTHPQQVGKWFCLVFRFDEWKTLENPNFPGDWHRLTVFHRDLTIPWNARRLRTWDLHQPSNLPFSDRHGLWLQAISGDHGEPIHPDLPLPFGKNWAPKPLHSSWRYSVPPERPILPAGKQMWI